jgi:hypothetical protein
MNQLLSEGSSHSQRRITVPIRTRTLSNHGLEPMRHGSSLHGNFMSASMSSKDRHLPKGDRRKTYERNQKKSSVEERGVVIEISPGVQARLRGTEETWQAILDGGYAPVHCVGCNTSLFAIQDCSFVLCPHCRVISPMDAADNKRDAVSMGFTFDDLVKWHPAAEVDRQKRSHGQLRTSDKAALRDKKIDSDRWQSFDRPSKNLRCPQRNRSGDLDAFATNGTS